MYNRYIPTEEGVYTRVTEEDRPGRRPHRFCPAAGWRSPCRRVCPFGRRRPERPGAPFSGADGIAAFLRRTLDQLHLDRIDTGDLLLLGLLYFLFREKADEELLAALGLLLIL